MRALAAVLLAICSISFFSSVACAEKRVALVVGNSAYQHANRLTNPGNDSSAISAAFKGAGFDIVELRQDLGVREMRRALRDFSDHVRGADIAIVYFAGHGIEIDGTNYVIPVDAVMERDIDAFDEAIPLDRMLTVIEPARQLRLVILDACRDNPFNKSMKRTIAARAIARGLAKVEPTSPNTLVAFAAKAGSTAADGDTVNSPFTAALIKYLTRPGLDLRKAFGFARDEVLRVTGNRQEPFIYGSLGGEDVALIPAVVVPPAAAAPADPNAAARRDYELADRIGTRPVWDSFINTYPSGFYADLAKAQRNKLLAEEKARAAAEEQKRLAAEGDRLAEQARAAAKAEAAERSRVAVEQRRAIEEAKIAEETRLATEKAKKAEEAKAKAEEAARVAAAKAKAEAEAKAAAEAAKLAEQTRIAAERRKAIEEAKAREEARIAAEKAKKVEEAKAEQQRLAAEKKKAEEAKAKAEEDARVAAAKAKAEADAKAAAEAAKVAEQARVAAEKARKAEEAKAEAKAKAEADLKTAADAKAVEQKRSEGEKPIGQLAALAPQGEAGAAKPATADIPRLLQAELRRVGCYAGTIDGNWNAASKKSLGFFNRNARTRLDVTLASLDALDIVRGKTGRVCPLVCEYGYQADGESCTKIICRPGFELGDGNACERIEVKRPERPRSAPEAERSQSPKPKVSQSNSGLMACSIYCKQKYGGAMPRQESRCLAYAGRCDHSR
jgi:uncharacterized caspase-like protein